MAIQMNATAVNQAAQQHSTEKRLDNDGGQRAVARTTTQEEGSARNEGTQKAKVVAQFNRVERSQRDEQQNREEKNRNNQEDAHQGRNRTRGKKLDFII